MNRTRCLIALTAVLSVLGSVIAEEPPPEQQHQQRQQEYRDHIQKERQKKREHAQQQRQENRVSRRSLPNKTSDKRIEAIKEHRAQHYQENRPFAQKEHDGNMAYLRERLAGTPHLTDQQKSELSNFFESQYREEVSFRNGQGNENVLFFMSVANNSTLTPVQKRQAIRDHFVKQRQKNQAKRQENSQERVAEREKVKPESGK